MHPAKARSTGSSRMSRDRIDLLNLWSVEWPCRLVSVTTQHRGSRGRSQGDASSRGPGVVDSPAESLQNARRDDAQVGSGRARVRAAQHRGAADLGPGVPGTRRRPRLLLLWLWRYLNPGAHRPRGSTGLPGAASPDSSRHRLAGPACPLPEVTGRDHVPVHQAEGEASGSRATIARVLLASEWQAVRFGAPLLASFPASDGG